MKQYNFNINGNSYEVTINSVEGNVADVTVKTSYKVELGAGGSPTQAAAAATAQAVVSAPETQTTATPAQTTPAAAAPSSASVPAPAPAPKAAGAGKKVTAPLPGNIVGINVKVGDAVKSGQQVAVLEAMKMENSIESPTDGTVIEILANVGDAVAADAPIMTIG